MRNTITIFVLLFSMQSFACGSFGNPGDGCADKVLGVQTVGEAIEIYGEGVNWYNNHVCSESTTMRFAGNELLTNASLSIGMAVYMSEKGPIYFRCNSKGDYNVCNCQIIVLGNTWRD